MPKSHVRISACFSLLLLSQAAALAGDEPIERKWFLGVGAHPTHHGYLVRAVTPGSPAFKANIYRGDYITSVNGLRVGFLPERKYRPLDMALNATEGSATLRIEFTTSQRSSREFETNAELSLRKERKPTETKSNVPQVSTIAVAAGEKGNASSGRIEIAQADAKSRVTEDRAADEVDAQQQTPRDERGVAAQRLNPVLADDDADH